MHPTTREGNSLLMFFINSILKGLKRFHLCCCYNGKIIASPEASGNGNLLQTAPGFHPNKALNI
jgi:hydroxymethylpyrimidine pyrophosphatase-like HAD family hydrolase